VYLNFELVKYDNSFPHGTRFKTAYGRLIFYTDNVDELFSYFQNNKSISEYIVLETKPKDASWGERYFHLRDPEGYQLSFAQAVAQK
jgi:uncharacterized glyoxalase superfamily protein PhnB